MRLDSDSRRWRQLVARMVLITGAIVQLALISALPPEHLTLRESRAFAMLTVMCVISIGTALIVARYPRGVIRILGAATLYSLWCIGRAVHLVQMSSEFAHGGAGPGVVLGFVVASLAYYSFPIAFLVAWPTRSTS